ncbi:hypothetical protein ANO11243_047330 [Dothideomycetidae sp. 11243]|nr:hypothetical protein ANO11243_047330 [fungal sp. No.11243]
MAPNFADIYESIVLHPTSDDNDPLLIFLITGNPGLVSYYNTYLHHLQALCNGQLLSSNSSRRIGVHIYSCSLAGFETSPCTGVANSQRNIYDLDQQIEYIDDALEHAGEDVSQRTGTKTPRVVLIGHSVGAYMLMEILRRRKAARATQMIKIVGGVCLTPTIVNLRGSPSGRKVSYIGSQTYFASAAASLANALLWPFPDALLLRTIKAITGMPDEAAATTFRFLRSPNGIHQALHMLRFELAQMTIDKWDDEIWGVSESLSNPRDKTKLFFYFADHDHWVANDTRDQLIAARASSAKMGEEDRPEMEVDRTGLPHAFCIRDEPVAEKTVGYIQKIVQLNWQ